MVGQATLDAFYIPLALSLRYLTVPSLSTPEHQTAYDSRPDSTEDHQYDAHASKNAPALA